MLSTNGTTSKGDMTPCGRRQEDYGRKAHHSLVADCRRSRRRRRSGRARAGSHEQPAADTDTALAGEWFGPWIGAGILVVCGTGRRPLRVPARSRRRFQLAGARARRGQLYDAQFSWDPVAGAARYQVEINSSSDFAPGSKVCCDSPTIATSLSPTTVFKDNTYYWRVRAVDPDGNTGVWNVGPSFTKSFDKVPPAPAPAIKNLHLRDNLTDPGTDSDPGTPGYQTHVPMLTWDWVPGASSYQVDVTPYNGSFCDWGAISTVHWRNDTAVNAWTPLGDYWFATKPYSDPLDVSNDFTSLINGQQYCARVRARSDRAGFDDIYGDYTYLDPNGLGWAFQFTGFPSGGACK